MRKLFAGLLLVAFAGGFYAYRQGGASKTVRREMLRLVDDLELSSPQHNAARRIVEAHHESVFAESIDVARHRGRKFDARHYQDEMFRRLIDDARADGDPELADRLTAQQHEQRLVVAEH